MFDLRTNLLRWETNVGNGVTCVELDRKDIEMNKLAVTTLESKFRLYDVRTQHPTDGFAFMSEKAHKSTVWVARYGHALLERLERDQGIMCTLGSRRRGRDDRSKRSLLLC
jgi:hypothetical protein